MSDQESAPPPVVLLVEDHPELKQVLTHALALAAGGGVRTGLEDTFYLPDGQRASSNGALIDAIVKQAREVGREIASPSEARVLNGLVA